MVSASGARNPASARARTRPRARARARAIAVGTTIAGRPPHRSVLAELLHTAPTVDVDVRNGLQDMDGGYGDWEANAGRFL